MKDQWRGCNVDLRLLTERTIQFFNDRRFEITLKQIPNGYEFEAATEKILDTRLEIIVRIYGQPNDFTTEFIANKGKETFSLSMIIGYLTSSFGGGSLLRADVKLKESLNKLEKMFWEHVDRQVAQLTQSATKK